MYLFIYLYFELGEHIRSSNIYATEAKAVYQNSLTIKCDQKNSSCVKNEIEDAKRKFKIWKMRNLKGEKDERLKNVQIFLNEEVSTPLQHQGAMAQRQRVGFQTRRLGVRIPLASFSMTRWPSG